MFRISKPRAATSVAHNTRASPLRKRLSAWSRLPWSRSPWISSVHRPRLLSSFNSQARSRQFFFVLLNTRQLPPLCKLPKISLRACFFASLESQILTCCVMFWLVVMSSVPIWICIGSLMYFLAKSRHSRGHVAVNIDICFSHGHLSRTCLICGSNPMSSIRSASSSTTNLTWSRRTTPESQKSFSRPGVAMRQSGPSLIFHSWSRLGAPP
mmetsp:Transcript_25253/g.75892  ORF Transcript_25253/g.75892 Transcript_25253/m.75892 type:complete len:211 (-) Transcript_25253:519-1151(-)